MSYNIKFMNLPEQFSNLQKSKVVILPIAYEGVVSRGFGASNGPLAILNASYELEYFDIDYNIEPYEQGIYTEQIFKLTNQDYEFSKQVISELVYNFLKINKFPIIIGGDHSITSGVVQGFEKKQTNFGIITFDAHSDLREPWGKETWQHACVSREISKNHKLLIVGVRSQDVSEAEFLKSPEGKNVSVINAKDVFEKNNLNVFQEKLKQLPHDIYISIDVDVFDPAFMKNTNTPEPGGLDWYLLNNFLKIIFKQKNVIGVDLVEFAPQGEEYNYFSEAFMLSKLIYKLIVYKYYTQKINL